ncbi:MAG: prepilin peptidase, partial [bacterium]|nr:prepilin peptidase [bacterium]
IAASLGLLLVLAAIMMGRRVQADMRVPLGTFLAIAAIPGACVTAWL